MMMMMRPREIRGYPRLQQGHPCPQQPRVRHQSCTRMIRRRAKIKVQTRQRAKSGGVAAAAAAAGTAAGTTGAVENVSGGAAGTETAGQRTMTAVTEVSIFFRPFLRGTMAMALGAEWETLNTGSEFDHMLYLEKKGQLEAMFRAHDKDGSGIIDSLELHKLIRQAYPTTSDRVLQVYHDVLLREADLDGDGNIAYHEFISKGMESDILKNLFTTVDRAEQMEKEFDEMDVDGSGSIDVAELKELIRRAFPKTGPTMRDRYLNAILLDCDADRSGTISKEELMKSEYFYMLAMADEEPLMPAAETPSKVKRYVSKSPGRSGGLAARCVATSPRRKAAPDWSEQVRCQSPSTKRPKTPLPVFVNRKEEDGFRATDDDGVAMPGDLMMDKGEAEIDRESGECNWHGAREYFIDAAFLYTVDGDNLRAGEAYIRAADCMAKLCSPIENAELLLKAAEAYRVSSPVDAIDCINEAISVYEQEGYSGMEAQLYKTIAELKVQIGDHRDAIDYYLQSAEFYGNPSQLTMKMACLKKVAALYATIGAYPEAVSMYEGIAKAIIDDNISGNPSLGRLEVKDIFLRSVICHLMLMDPRGTGLERITACEKAQKAFERYGEMDMENFSSGLEYRCARDLIETQLKQDTEKMAETINILKSSRDLEPWVKDTLRHVQDNLALWLEILSEKLK
mmetsp:Transcript_38289/g.68341  ORF Transcript_38289/g.68341 Transcript_38289/m.68341 type:complete len:681 (-) Transcript_38289:382-2424(-)